MRGIEKNSRRELALSRIQHQENAIILSQHPSSDSSCGLRGHQPQEIKREIGSKISSSVKRSEASAVGQVTRWTQKVKVNLPDAESPADDEPEFCPPHPKLFPQRLLQALLPELAAVEEAFWLPSFCRQPGPSM